MHDESRSTGGSEQIAAPPAREPVAYPGPPRWVKTAGLLILVLILLVVAATVLGLHTPGGPGGHGL